MAHSEWSISEHWVTGPLLGSKLLYIPVFCANLCEDTEPIADQGIYSEVWKVSYEKLEKWLYFLVSLMDAMSMFFLFADIQNCVNIVRLLKIIVFALILFCNIGEILLMKSHSTLTWYSKVDANI
jgi:hypothetical protein